MTVALVPMKDLGAAKQRLSSILSDEERMGLVKAMLQDVLSALQSAERIEQVFIVAHDAAFQNLGVPVLEEAGNTGYNEAIEFALTKPPLADSASLLILPGDVPLTSAAEIDALAEPAGTPTVRLSPARDGDGTNGIMISPPDIIGTAFGIGSFERHRSIAQSAGVQVDVVRGPGIAFDIDTPEDLVSFCSVDGTSETHTYLDLSGIRRRLLAENA